MTVPGKCGRPRKGRSDAEGDELARATEEVRALRVELVATAATEQELRDEVRSLRREPAARDERFGWLEQTSEAQRIAEQAAERERDALAGELTELRARTRVATSGTRPIPDPSSAPPTPSRAERRRPEREQQKRRD